MTRTLLLSCLVCTLLALGAACTEPDRPGSAAEGDQPEDSQEQASDDEEEVAEEPETGDRVLPPRARLAKSRLWQDLIHSETIDPRRVRGEMEGQTIVLRVTGGSDETASALRTLAASHLDEGGHAWRVEVDPPPAVPDASPDRETAPREEPHSRRPPEPGSLRQLLTLTETEPFERDPRLEYDRDEPPPAHIVRAATGDRPLTYRVRAGDSLSLIAQRTMGSGVHWQRIHELNRHIIGPDPARLVEGMELRIPQE